MAFGSQFRRFHVRHRQVTKGFPRTHLGSFLRANGLDLILDLWRLGFMGHVVAHQMQRRFVVCFKFLAGYY